MEYNINTQNRSKQILAMYGINTDDLQKSQNATQQAVTQDELQKSEQTQQEAVKQEAIVAKVTDDLNKSQNQENLENQNQGNDFTKSLEALMAPITFD